MLIRASLTLVTVAGLIAVPLAACSSTDAVPTPTPESGACEAYVPPSTFDPATFPAPFSVTPTNPNQKSVLQIINQSCAFSSCHGSVAGPTGGMYLGSNLSKTYSNLVGVAANIYPAMDRVKAGDPANSFLQHKIDGDSCTLSECTSTLCTELMPQGQDLMAVNDRLTIRAWIAQGAKADFTLEIPDAGSNDAGDAGGE